MNGSWHPRMPPGNILRGMFHLAIGDASGLREFGNTTAAFSASIAPLLAFPLVGSMLFGIQGHWLLATSMLLSRICGVLAQPVIVQATARRTRNEATWLVTSTTLNWSIWLIFPLILIGMIVSTGFTSLGASGALAITLTVVIIVFYMLWLQWFILRAGLKIRSWVALLVLLILNVTIASLYAIPYAFHPELLALTLTPSAG